MPDPNDPNQQQQQPQPPAQKQGFFANLGGDIASVLSSPSIQEVLPAVVGAAGAMLTSPRHSGRLSQIGRGLEGGLQGYEVGTQEQLARQNAQAQQLYRTTMMKHLAVQDQLAEGKIPAEQLENKQAAAFNALPDATKSQYGYDPKQWAHAQATVAIKSADTPSKQQAIAAMLQSPSGHQYLATNYNINSVNDIPTDPTYLEKILGNRGNAAKIQADLIKDQAETARAQAGVAESGAHIQETEAGAAVKEAELKGTLPARQESPEVKAKNKAETDYLIASTPARIEQAKDKVVQDNVSTVQKVEGTYDKEHPIRGNEAGRNAAVLKSGYDPLTSKPLPGGAMKPTGKPARTSNGTLLSEGLHVDGKGNVAYVLGGLIYTH